MLSVYKNLFLVVATASCFAVSPTTVLANEFRGLWVDAYNPGFFNVGQVKKLVSDCRKYNFNAVIVEMRRRGDAFYFPGPNNPEPRTTIIKTNLDCLAEIIKECHAGTPRIEVHCWVVSHFIWAWEKPPRQPNHVFNLNPEYLTKDSIGQKIVGKGYFLDPGNPDANQWIHDVVKDIVSRYDIDGLHWDYFRYPVRDSGYNETAIKRYNEEFSLKGEPTPADPKFCDWRRRQVTDSLRWINADMLEIKPSLVISASVFANYHDAYGYRFQEWAEWNKEGILDVSMPMDFSADNQNVFNPRLEEALKNQGTRQIYIGQAAYMNSKENTLTQLNLIRGKGFLGSVLYSYHQPNSETNSAKADRPGTFTYFKENFQPQWVDSPVLPWKKTKAIIKGMVTENGKPVYNATVSINAQSPRSQKTEPHGKFAFFEVNPGSYTLRAKIDSAEATSRQIEIKAGQVVNVDLALSR